MAIRLNTLHNRDCISGLKQLDDGVVDLAFADPPFNIGYQYDVYEDALEAEKYLAWSRDWTAEVVRVLKPQGTFWLAIGDEYAAELKVMLQQEHGLCCRSWVVWYYTFGVNCTHKFSRSHVHMFYMVKDPQKFTFNADDPAIRVPSARQLVYADKRANPKGRLPDDTWILRPQDLPDGFSAGENTWYFPRVCGTFSERAGWHGCQMPEQLLGRIIRACSNEGDLVLDPFAGSGTTLAVAKKLRRRFVGFEISEQYACAVRKRLAAIKSGTALQGTREPLTSVPSTAAGRRLGEHRSLQKLLRFSEDVKMAPHSFDPQDFGIDLPKEEFMDRMVDAFNERYKGNLSVDELLLHPREALAFCDSVRSHYAYFEVPDHVILRSILQRRKNP